MSFRVRACGLGMNNSRKAEQNQITEFFLMLIRISFYDPWPNADKVSTDIMIYTVKKVFLERLKEMLSLQPINFDDEDWTTNVDESYDK